MDTVTINTLTHFWQLAHRTQATGADIHVFGDTIDLKAAALYIKYEATTRTMLRKWNVIAVHRLTLAHITTSSRHISSSENCNRHKTIPSLEKVRGMPHGFYLIILWASVILHPENLRNDRII